MYTDAGEQYIQPAFDDVTGLPDGAGFAPVAFRWQYEYLVANQLPNLSKVAGSLAAATYYYAFTLYLSIPGVPVQNSALGYVGAQETSGYGAAPQINGIFKFFEAVNGAQGVNISTNNSFGSNLNKWSGQFPDGTDWFINIYRMSSNQPTWYLLASPILTGTSVNMLINGNAFTDNTPDTSIIQNQQLIVYQDPPPITAQQPTLFNPYAFHWSYVNGAIFSHKERMWCLALQNTTDGTFSLTQSQLWYSNYGTPWSFSKVNQVILVGNDGAPMIGPADSFSSSNGGVYNPHFPGHSNYPPGPFGDQPVAGASLSSVGVIHMSKSLWILYGDDATTFVIRKVGQYGTLSRRSVTVCQGLDCALYDEGVFTFDGASAPQYISEEIRTALQAIPPSDQANSVGWFANRSYYLSFPATGITFVYYFPLKKWRTLPYGAVSAFSVPSQNPPAPGLQRNNYIVGARPNSSAIDCWDCSFTDIGIGVNGSWVSPVTDSGGPGSRKSYDLLVLNAPVQTTIVQVTLTIDPGGAGTALKTTTWNVDLSKGPTSVFTVPNGTDDYGVVHDNTGFLAQLSVSATSSASAQVQIYSLAVLGSPQDISVPFDDGSVV